MPFDLVNVLPDTEAFASLLRLADEIRQSRCLAFRPDHCLETVLIGAYGPRDRRSCFGFLYLLIQVIGSDEGRPPIPLGPGGALLREGYVEAFGVAPGFRRRGIGRRMQEEALSLCREKGCYQIRSRSPVSSTENYALKVNMGYAIHPSDRNDSYFFLKTLAG